MSKNKTILISLVVLVVIFTSIFVFNKSKSEKKVEVKKAVPVAAEKQLEAYRPTINYIKKYKQDKGKFPQSMYFDKVISKSHPYCIYQNYENGKYFTLTVSENKIDKKCTSSCYRICSSQDLPSCKAGGKYVKVGEWVYSASEK